jgi:hypothetical protein
MSLPPQAAILMQVDVILRIVPGTSLPDLVGVLSSETGVVLAEGCDALALRLRARSAVQTQAEPVIADTDLFLDLMHARGAHHSRMAEGAKELAERGFCLAMTAITWFKFATGIEQERERVHRLVGVGRSILSGLSFAGLAIRTTSSIGYPLRLHGGLTSWLSRGSRSVLSAGREATQSEAPPHRGQE